MKAQLALEVVAASLAVLIASGSVWSASPFEWQDSPGEHLDLLYEGRPALRYMYAKADNSSPENWAATFKPYHHVFSPDGAVLLTNGPGARLYPHHHGVFYGFNRITHHDDQECDVWHCPKGECTRHEREISRSADENGGRHRAAIEWRGRKGELFANEEREVSLVRGENSGTPGWLIDFSSHLESADGEPVHLDGDPQHAGLHFRAAAKEIGPPSANAGSAEAAENKARQIYFVRTDGKGSLGETRNWDGNQPGAPQNAECENRPWNAMSFEIDGKRYTVLYIAHPDNPKPQRYSERAYGRFGSYFAADLTKEQPLDVRYRLWVQAGEMTPEQCAALHDEYVRLPVKLSKDK